MILCPNTKIKLFLYRNPYKFFINGESVYYNLVLWRDCLKCQFFKGCNENNLTIECGFNPKKTITRQWYPI